MADTSTMWFSDDKGNGPLSTQYGTSIVLEFLPTKKKKANTKRTNRNKNMAALDALFKSKLKF